MRDVLLDSKCRIVTEMLTLVASEGIPEKSNDLISMYPTAPEVVLVHTAYVASLLPTVPSTALLVVVHVVPEVPRTVVPRLEEVATPAS
jgi:hypothetical protein